MVNVFIDGSSGTTGIKIFDRLESRSDINLITLDNELRKDENARTQAMNSSDITFLCLPDDAARRAAENARGNVKIIDTSTAHRTQQGWSYGFPELSPGHREAIRSGSRIAVPGCHASGFCALMYPLVSSGIIADDYPVVCHSLTGYSGGGKKMIAEYESEERKSELSSPAQYALGAEHKHLKEMKAVCGLAEKPIFNPIVADYYSGMVVSIPLYSRLMKKKLGVNELRNFFAEYYAGERLISVPQNGDTGAENGFLYSNTLAGKDNMEIIISGNDERMLVAARFCNLGKGASGAAMQCMNIIIGCDETTGLVL